MHNVVLEADGMTIEEAIKLLEIQKPVLGCKEYKKPLMYAYEMAISALEKQIPKKMNDIDEYEENELCGYCPQCNKLQSNLWNKNFCGDCGQAIDWSEEE